MPNRIPLLLGLGLALGFGEITITPVALASPNVVEDIRALIRGRDDLGLRIYVKKMKKNNLSPDMLNAIRVALHGRPNVGYDLIKKWESFSFEKLIPKQGKVVAEINRLIQSGHKLYGDKKYSEAFQNYQTAAQKIKKGYRGNLPHFQEHIYYLVVHQMARCLYSMNRFSEATDVFQWIPRSYFQFRQVLFEKMWSAFRASRIDTALGAMASQQSGYFSHFLEPEAYLLRIYLLKQLCRDEQVQKTLTEVNTFLSDLDENKYTLQEWAKTDIDTIVMQRLIDPPGPGTQLGEFVSTSARISEKEKIRKVLETRFNNEKERLRASLKKVIGFSKIIINGKTKELKMISSLPDSAVLRASAKDLWASNDAEEWIDELGAHYFVGKSKCKK
jgi:hypothetical protein